ncbi:DUF748 domain-containing protein [Geomonas sp. Red69]|uniref:DUF748 domain-containing protein n=1 Tax=Geomonas diazotrophica TaxID=2843197 RepID=A0ABX8JK63_9BACT|nr:MULTISPECIES: DUF748 domain-containing protein [Geomonas]MBU5635436.1 DUF748 domain-containing protein [Geomonas diazotrophica]QWV97511.1 DUF748 domain-containing protein [Geomonas nitrogeniifigens]QXE86651.1 DUF748 domain-containing protein [Geomonas nitrogeniifigens]
MVEPKEPAPRDTRHGLAVPKVLLWIVGIMVSLVLIAFIASFFIDEPLRRTTEKKMNQSLKGYKVRLPRLHFSLIGLSVTLKGLTITQEAHPEPPVAEFPYLRASVQWREVLSGRLVGDMRVDGPKIHVDLQQLKSEAASKVPMKQKGWQQAFEAIYPLKINLLKITDGSLTYIDEDPKRPLKLTHLNLSANNIRNIHLPDKVYPSDFQMETDIFGTGHGRVEGRADFLAEPTPAVKAVIELAKVPIAYFAQLAARSNVRIEGGVLSASGDVEFGRKVQTARLKNLNINGVRLDYIHTPETARAEARRAEKVKRAAKEVSNKPNLVLTIEHFILTDANVGFINDYGGKKVRLFLSDANLYLDNFSNQFSKGPAKARLSGRFMGSGVTEATATFRPEDKGPDLDLYLKIDNTQLVSLNGLLRSYGNFDVTAGTFSLVTELHVKNNRVNGYIKPFFKDMKVYDRRQDKNKGFFHRVYEMLVGGIAKLLENRPRDQVATKADISGPVQNPRTSTWQVVVELIRNAFIKAILPTFERDVTALGKRK